MKYNLQKTHRLFVKLLNDNNSLDVPQFHTEILDRFEEDTRLQLTVAPVGFSKSMLAKSFVLNNLFNGVKFQLYVSSSFGKVTDQFTTFLSIIDKPIVKSIFEYTVVTKNQNEIILDFNGQKRKIQGIASGADILGINFESQRPQVIMIDDLEELEQANSIERTTKLIEWLESTLLTRTESADKGLIRMIGTNLTRNSIVNRIITGQKPEWNYKVYTALQDNKSIWEERHSTQGLLQLQINNPKSFASNYMNAPLDNATSLINESDIRYYTSINIDDFDELYLHADTTHTGNLTSDYFCAGVIGKSKDNKYYLLDFKLEKIDVEQQARSIIPLYQRYSNKIKKVTYDEKANQGFGYWIKKLAREEYNLSLPIEELKYSSNKEAHFEPHVPHFKANAVYLPQDHKSIHQAVAQLTSFPSKTVHDDFVDMLSGCLDNFKNDKNKTTVGIFF
jgi:predicted phage terminase large subunit-like protein